jgi:hypothetical protein
MLVGRSVRQTETNQENKMNNIEQEVNAVAKWLRDEWMDAPCWRALARKVLSVEDEACESAPEPECQTNRFDTFEEFMEHALGESCPNDGVFRLLQEGDVIQYGDQVRLCNKWYPIHETSVVGQYVQSAESAALPAGFYRRPLDEEKDVDCTMQKQLEQLEVLQERFEAVVKERNELFSKLRSIHIFTEP